MRQSRTRPIEELTPERLATNFTNYSNEFRGISVIRGQAFSEFVAICGGGTNRVGFPYARKSFTRVWRSSGTAHPNSACVLRRLESWPQKNCGPVWRFDPGLNAKPFARPKNYRPHSPRNRPGHPS